MSSDPEYPGDEPEHNAALLSTSEWIERTRHRPQVNGELDTVAALDEMRGPWPT
jgi:hypothetical protein